MKAGQDRPEVQKDHSQETTLQDPGGNTTKISSRQVPAGLEVAGGGG